VTPYQYRLLPPTTPVCGGSSLGQPMGSSCRLNCSIDRTLNSGQIRHATFGGDLYGKSSTPPLRPYPPIVPLVLLASWDSDTAAIARICPARSNFTSTASPGLGGTSDFQTPSMLNQYCRPSIISRPGPARGSRSCLASSCLSPANQGKQNQLCERTQGGRLFRIGSHTLAPPLLCGFPCSHFALRKG